jgi:hypothetical protein
MAHPEYHDSRGKFKPGNPGNTRCKGNPTLLPVAEVKVMFGCAQTEADIAEARVRLLELAFRNPDPRVRLRACRFFGQLVGLG